MKPLNFNKRTKVLILGDKPGQLSESTQHYYEKQNNHFWKILESCFDLENNSLHKAKYEDKVKFLMNNNIALWDVKEFGNSFNDVLGKIKEIGCHINCIIFNGEDNLVNFYLNNFSNKDILKYNIVHCYQTSGLNIVTNNYEKMLYGGVKKADDQIFYGVNGWKQAFAIGKIIKINENEYLCHSPIAKWWTLNKNINAAYKTNNVVSKIANNFKNSWLISKKCVDAINKKHLNYEDKLFLQNWDNSSKSLKWYFKYKPINPFK